MRRTKMTIRTEKKSYLETSNGLFQALFIVVQIIYNLST